MARKILIRTNEYPYHITARTINKEWFFLGPADTWNIFVRHLSKMKIKFNVRIHAFVMMSNHFHLLVSTPDSNIDKAMHYFMSTTAREIAAKAHRINKIWGARYYRSVITTPEYYAHAFRYLYHNPIRAGIAKNINSYPWSTFLQKNAQKLIVQCEGFDAFIPDTQEELSAWINQPTDEIYLESVRKALRRSYFQFSKSKGIKKYDQFRAHLHKNTNHHVQYFESYHKTLNARQR